MRRESARGYERDGSPGTGIRGPMLFGFPVACGIARSRDTISPSLVHGYGAPCAFCNCIPIGAYSPLRGIASLFYIGFDACSIVKYSGRSSRECQVVVNHLDIRNSIRVGLLSFLKISVEFGVCF